MKRKPGFPSMDLRTRAFGTAGRRNAREGTPAVPGERIDLTGAILRRPIVPSGAGKWKPRPGRIYDFPVRRVVEEK